MLKNDNPKTKQEGIGNYIYIQSHSINTRPKTVLDLSARLCTAQQSGACAHVARGDPQVLSPQRSTQSSFQKSSEASVTGISTVPLDTSKRSKSKTGQLSVPQLLRPGLAEIDVDPHTQFSPEELIGENAAGPQHHKLMFLPDAQEKCRVGEQPESDVPAGHILQTGCRWSVVQPVRSITACSLQSDGPTKDTFITLLYNYALPSRLQHDHR